MQLKSSMISFFPPGPEGVGRVTIHLKANTALIILIVLLVLIDGAYHSL